MGGGDYQIPSSSTKKYRICLFTKGQVLPRSATEWTKVYEYAGSGWLYNVWMDLSGSNVEIKIVIDDSDEVIPPMLLLDMAGFGGAGQATMLPLVCLGGSNFAFTPAEKIRFDSKVEVFLRTQNNALNDKTLTCGYAGMVKET